MSSLVRSSSINETKYSSCWDKGVDITIRRSEAMRAEAEGIGWNIMDMCNNNGVFTYFVDRFVTCTF